MFSSSACLGMYITDACVHGCGSHVHVDVLRRPQGAGPWRACPESAGACSTRPGEPARLLLLLLL